MSFDIQVVEESSGSMDRALGVLMKSSESFFCEKDEHYSISASQKKLLDDAGIRYKIISGGVKK